MRIEIPKFKSKEEAWEKLLEYAAQIKEKYNIEFTAEYTPQALYAILTALVQLLDEKDKQILYLGAKLSSLENSYMEKMQELLNKFENLCQSLEEVRDDIQISHNTLKGEIENIKKFHIIGEGAITDNIDELSKRISDIEKRQANIEKYLLNTLFKLDRNEKMAKKSNEIEYVSEIPDELKENIKRKDD